MSDADIARKGLSIEEIIAALREAEVKLGQGETGCKIFWGLGVSGADVL